MNCSTDQQAAIEKLSRLRAGALFMQMGTGKTRVALELAKGKQADYDAVCWIAPASLLAEASYRIEIARWIDGLNRPIHLHSIEGVSQSDRQYLALRTQAETERLFCVIDESLSIKNVEAKRTARLLAMWHLFPFRLLLNGTPLSKGLIDLYAQMQFLHPKILNMTEAQFAHHFLTYKLGGERPWQRWSRPANEAALVEMLRPYIFDAALDLPVLLTEQHHDCPLTPGEQEEYRAMKEQYLAGHQELAFLPTAQAFQAHYTLCQTKAALTTRLLATGVWLVFVKFQREVEALTRDFPEALVFSGTRKDDLRAFGKTARILIATYGTGSKGLNLQQCHRVLFHSQTFDYAQKEHALHRVYRMGQTQPVEAHHCWTDTGLEHIIRTSLTKKHAVLGHVKHLITPEEARAL